jgi:alpha-ketoglutarate-dependent sulfate ester dioxygenase
MTSAQLSEPEARSQPTARETQISVYPLTPNIGAEVRGLDLAKVSSGTVAAIRSALLAHKVLFFRAQPSFGPEEQVAFARHLGSLTGGHPTLPSVAANGHILELDSATGGRADHWHTDVTFAVEPPAISVLRAVEIPPVGGDTQWASTEAAYDRLPPPLKALAEGLHAIHTNAYDYARYVGADKDAEARKHRDRFVSTVFETEHPVVRVHPETGRPTLLLGGFARQIVGLPQDVSADLLRVFASYVTRPEHIVRWRWEAGDVAIWDNRATQHYAVNDYGDAHRVVQRVTVSGTQPIGVDGWRSQPRRGDASGYQAGFGAPGGHLDNN